MRLDNSSSPISADKWQRMLDIVSQHREPILSDSVWQFRKLLIYRLLSENLLTFLFQYIGLVLVDVLTPQTMAPMWFSSGSACAFIFMRGYTVLPGILLGSLSAYYFSTNDIIQSGLYAAIDAAQAFLLLWLSYRFISPTLIFYNIGKFIRFILCCSILTAISTSIFFLSHYPSYHHAMYHSDLWLRWWLGNLGGILIISLTILSWDFYFPQIDELKKINKATLTLCYGLLFINIIALLLSQTAFLTILLTLSTLPIILLISLHFGWCGVIAAVFSFGLFLNFSTYVNTRLFSTDFAQISLIYIQAILITETIAGLFIAIRMRKFYSELG